MASPTKGPRKSLADLFENLEIESTATPSPKRRTRMVQGLRDTISKGWPPKFDSLPKSEPVSLTIRSDEVYRQYGQDQDPKHLFEKATGWISAIQNVTTSTNSSKHADIIHQEIQEALIRAIFGSNKIERAGLGWDITLNLCRRIFAGEELGEITERDPTYQEQLADLYRSQKGLEDLPIRFVLRSRNEVVQHAKAYQHLINAFVVKKEDLTENLIKATHKILTTGVPIIEEPEVPPEMYGGIYRTCHIQAGTTNFSNPKFVAKHMKETCEKLKQELDSAEAQNSIDPFSIAAKYSLEFVMIHPFQDGNGRMCRMILNAILCKYAGVIVPIGEQGDDRSEYMAIKKRASNDMQGHGEYATFVLKKATTRLRELKKKITGKESKKN